MRPTYYHAYTDYAPKDPDTARRNAIAQETWKTLPWSGVPIKDEMLPRLWKEEGRQFAYIKDMFDVACRGRLKTDIIVYTNADIHVRGDLCTQLDDLFTQTTACYCYRRDFGRLHAPLKFADYEKGSAYCGSDLAAFRVIWWLCYRHAMADLILGLEAWDPIFRHLADITNVGKRNALKDVIGHERHNSYWERKENRHRLKGQIYCRELAAKWLRNHGIDPRHHGL